MKRTVFLLVALAGCNPLEDPLDVKCVQTSAPAEERILVGTLDDKNRFNELPEPAQLELLPASGGGRIVILALQWYAASPDPWGHELSLRSGEQRVGERSVVLNGCGPGWSLLEDISLRLSDQTATQAELRIESGASADGMTFTKTASTSRTVTFR